MSSPVALASFCRLCLSKTKDKVPIFEDESMLTELLHLIDIQIEPAVEPGAVVCLDCIVTLEGFSQFKEQCHVNDEFVRTIVVTEDCAISEEKEEDEVEEEEKNAREDFSYVEVIEAENQLGLSEVEEEFKSAKSNKNETSAKRPQENTTQKSESTKTSTGKLQVSKNEYPDFIYFEKNTRSIYYTLVFHEERYDSALYTEDRTYWQCIHRKKYQCPAQVWVTNDNTTFEQRYEHTHDKVPVKKRQTFTPQEALPEIILLSKKLIPQNLTENETFEDKFQKFATEIYKDDELASPSNESKSITDSDSAEKNEDANRMRPKRKTKPNLRYAVEENQPKKRSRMKEPETEELYESEAEDDINFEEDLDLDKLEEVCKNLKIRKRSKQGPSLDEQLVLAESYPDYFFFEKLPRSVLFNLVFYGERYHSAMFSEYYTYWKCQQCRKYKCPAQVRVTNDYKTFERRYEHNHPDVKVAEGTPFTPMEALPEIFEVCRKAVLKNRVKLRKKLLQKHLQSVNLNTSADEQISNTEIVEEVFLEEQDEDGPCEEGLQQLVDDSDVEACEEEDVSTSTRPKRKTKPNGRCVDEKIPLEKQSLESEVTSKSFKLKVIPQMREVKKGVCKKRESDEDEAEAESDTIVEDDLDLSKLEEECKTLKIRKRSKIGPSLDEQLVLADSYPDYFFFEKFPRSQHLNLVYYGEQFFAAVFTEYYTYWHCRQRRKNECPALVRVTNDYKTFERRHEHNHPDILVKGGEAFTPIEALPKLFEVCRSVVLKYRAKRRKKVLEKHKVLQAVNTSTEQEVAETKSIEEVYVLDQNDEVFQGEIIEELEVNEI